MYLKFHQIPSLDLNMIKIMSDNGNELMITKQPLKEWDMCLNGVSENKNVVVDKNVLEDAIIFTIKDSV